MKRLKPMFHQLSRALVLLTAATALSVQADTPEDEYSVILETTKGDIQLQLFPEQAPETVANFLGYVDEGFYDGLIFHRVIPNFMAQGGGFDADLNQRQPGRPIQNESDNGLGNVRGTIAMARTQAPHSATSQFFINVQDNTNLNQQGSRWGYAVFGEVTQGMTVVDDMVGVERQTMRTAAGAMGDVPVEPIIIERAYRVSQP